jgi:hypothetical protein
MIKPNKHLDPRFSVVRVGALIIQALKENGLLRFDELLAVLINETDKRVKDVFLPSLSFLFLLGKIRYHKNIDSLELITN